jgi:Kef-type K+ transport system membrane component KefB
MKLTTPELIDLLVACGLLLIAARCFGGLFARYRQPPVIGEILGGLLLGPTVLGYLAPEFYQSVFRNGTSSEVVLDAIQQFGLIALMFCSGASLNLRGIGGDTKVIAAITIAGLIPPFIAGIAMASLLDTSTSIGTAGNDEAFMLVCGIAFAIVSVPVISRILRDLGILESRLARVIISSAVLQDIVLYIILAAAVAMANVDSGAIQNIVLDAPRWVDILVKVLIAVVFANAVLFLVPRFLRFIDRIELLAFARSSPTTVMILLAIAIIVVGLLIGLPSLLSALVAGAALRNGQSQQNAEIHSIISRFAYCTVIPIYFAAVGLRLNLLTDFDLVNASIIIVTASIVAFTSVYVASRLVGEPAPFARQLAVAMNARGGPGIVLATVALDTGIISEMFFTSLIALAIVTSLAAANWLAHELRENRIELGTQPQRVPTDVAEVP